MRTSKLIKSAYGKGCTIRFYNYCNGDPTTTVLAHVPCDRRRREIKSPDWWAALSCSGCFNVLNGSVKTGMSKETIYIRHIRGVYRTINRHIEDGLISHV